MQKIGIVSEVSVVLVFWGILTQYETKERRQQIYTIQIFGANQGQSIKYTEKKEYN